LIYFFHKQKEHRIFEVKELLKNIFANKIILPKA